MPASNVLAIPRSATVTAMTSNAYVMAKVWSKIRSTSRFSSPFVRIMTGGLTCSRSRTARPRVDQEMPDDQPLRPVVVVHADVALAVRGHEPGKRLESLMHGLRQGPFRAVAQPRRWRHNQVRLHGLV